MFKLFRDAEGHVTVGIGSLFLENQSRAAFQAQGCVGLFDEVIADTGADREPVFHIRNRVMKSLVSNVSVPAIGEEPVILSIAAQAFVVLHIIVLPVGGIG